MFMISSKRLDSRKIGEMSIKKRVRSTDTSNKAEYYVTLSPNSRFNKSFPHMAAFGSLMRK